MTNFQSSLSPTSPKTAANPFTIDDEMFEEYRKYEEMYLQEKQQKLKNQHKASDVISNEDDDGPMNNKINSDSAYSRSVRGDYFVFGALTCDFQFENVEGEG